MSLKDDIKVEKNRPKNVFEKSTQYRDAYNSLKKARKALLDDTDRRLIRFDVCRWLCEISEKCPEKKYCLFGQELKENQIERLIEMYHPEFKKIVYLSLMPQLANTSDKWPSDEVYYKVIVLPNGREISVLFDHYSFGKYRTAEDRVNSAHTPDVITSSSIKVIKELYSKNCPYNKKPIFVPLEKLSLKQFQEAMSIVGIEEREATETEQEQL